MDTTIITIMSGVLGSVVGGTATVATTWIVQRTLSQRQLVAGEMQKREALYGEFINEASKLYMDSLTKSLDEPEKVLLLYEILNRVKLSASNAVLAEADRTLQRIMEQYFSPNLSTEEVRTLIRSRGEADLLKDFGQACRVELKSMRARV